MVISCWWTTGSGHVSTLEAAGSLVVCLRTSAERTDPQRVLAHYIGAVTWPQVARAALVLTVVGLLVSAQVQIWSAPPAYDVGGRPLNAALAAAFTLPLLLARRLPAGRSCCVVLGCRSRRPPAGRQPRPAVVRDPAGGLRAGRLRLGVGVRRWGCSCSPPGAERRHPAPAGRRSGRRGPAGVVHPRRDLGAGPMDAASARGDDGSGDAGRGARARPGGSHPGRRRTMSEPGSRGSCTTWWHTAWR